MLQHSKLPESRFVLHLMYKSGLRSDATYNTLGVHVTCSHLYVAHNSKVRLGVGCWFTSQS